MNWKVLFSRFKKPDHTVTRKNLDSKLIKRINLRQLPKLSQLKYVGSFLSTVEKKVVIGGLIVSLVGLLGWTTVFLSRHYERAPKVGGEYIEGLIGQPKYINPIFSTTNDVDADIVGLVYAGLFKYSKEGTIESELAESYELSKDKKTYTVKLKPNLKWPDGQPITGQDVSYTFETIQNPEVGSPLFAAMQGVKIETPDELTISFTLKESFSPFLGVLTTGILPSHLWSEIPPASIKLAKLNSQPVGAGVWKFSKLIKDEGGNIQTLTLAPNDLYYGQHPYLKIITFKFYNNYTEAINGLRGQNINGIAFVPQKLKDKVGGKNINLYEFTLPQYSAMFFNQNQSTELKDKDLRLALNLAIDKERIIREALDGAGVTIDSPILPGMLGYDATIKDAEFNPELANKTLDKKWTRIQPEEYFSIKQTVELKNYQTEIEEVKKNASSTPEMVSSTLEKITNDAKRTVRQTMDAGQSFYRKDSKGNILALTITTADTPEYLKTAQTIATFWRALGIQTNIQSLSGYQLNKDIVRDRNYQIFLYGEIVGADPDPYSFWHSSQGDYPGMNLAMFSDRNADKVLEEARTTFSSADRVKLYKKFQEIVTAEIPAIFLYTPKHLMAISQDIKGARIENPTTPANRFQYLSEWYTKTTWRWKSN